MEGYVFWRIRQSEYFRWVCVCVGNNFLAILLQSLNGTSGGELFLFILFNWKVLKITLTRRSSNSD